MLGKRNDLEESAADREIAFSRVTSAWVLVLVILFWATTPLPKDRSVRFSIQGSLGGDATCTEGEGECTEGREMTRTSQAMPQEFHALPAMVWKAWTDPKHVSEMMAAFSEEGKSQLTMRMFFVLAEARDQDVRE
jgi:hypothetical protein